MLSYFGYVILILFIIFMLQMVREGPFIFEKGTTHYIQIKDLKFNITELKIKQGDTVEIINFEQFRHSIIVDDPTINNSELMLQYDKYRHTFNKEGTFVFKSSLYDNMNTLTVIVEETTKGRAFYGEILTNLGNFVKEFIKTILFYIRYTYLRLIH